MKKILTLTLIFFYLFSNGQNLNGYKYVYVETLKYKRDNTNRVLTDYFEISENVKESFKKMDFIVLNDLSDVPNELKNNLGLLLTCSISHTNVVFDDETINLTLINNNKDIVGKYTGVGKNFNRAIKKVFYEISKSRYEFDQNKTPDIQVSSTEKELKEYFDKANLEPLEGIYKSYESRLIGHLILAIKKYEKGYKAILIESENKNWLAGEIKATLKPTSIKNLYLTKWYTDYKLLDETFTKIENGGFLSVELRNSKNGQKEISKFVKTYPFLENKPENLDVSIKSTGSGFFISKDGLIATNAHIVQNANEINIIINNNSEKFNYKAKVVLLDNQNDVALLKIDDSSFFTLDNIPYSLIEKAEIGEKVYTIGYPLNNFMGENYKVTDGIISSLTGIADDVRYYQTTVPLQPGNSGGPLFNSSGNIIGITSSRLNGKAIGIEVENVNYAIKISYLLNLYKMLPDSKKLDTTLTSSNEKLQDQVKILKDFICLIKVN
ncbi:trypsin-like peptidase domain-containing protein [Psychroflexus sp. YR1-1]|uniref:Trypsin-like peptidase domain-containing protein n=1 Tax=Psychroflexus aurantiacus TaxID=2709310 RepID=A0A6B3R0T5_9FLAO|nr:serine protease [Psychroflexus aurantiacus]NEV94196.1 trypsin-like peptidase domain-containing protein [Psychroflexus aurantiacus]